jgi:hypothetical protein
MDWIWTMIMSIASGEESFHSTVSKYWYVQDSFVIRWRSEKSGSVSFSKKAISKCKVYCVSCEPWIL